MTSECTGKEFHRGNEFTVQVELTQEQLAHLKEWSAMVPTIHFLDICVVDMTKLSEAALQENERKGQFVAYLKSLDKPHNCFSYLFALVEKVSDSRGRLSDSELEQQILGDVAALRAFFKNAHVQEPDEFLIEFVRELRGAATELKRTDYLEFLEIANNRLELYNPVSPALKFKKAQEILSAADRLSISRQHPVVLVILACLYGNAAAKRLMKFKEDPRKFNAENALADIMVISRFARFKLELEQLGREGQVQYVRTQYVTDDDGLIGIHNCFSAKSVKLDETEGGLQSTFQVGVNLELLMPDLVATRQAESQQPVNGGVQKLDEYEQVLRLISEKP